MSAPEPELNYEQCDEVLSNPGTNAEYVQKCGSILYEKKENDLDVQCICCGALLSEEFAIWFRHRYYCCKECLPEETSRGYRLVCYHLVTTFIFEICFLSRILL